MLSDNLLPLLPLDICVPVQEFRADYTIVQNNQLPFVREFILRLLDIKSFTKDQIGKFMGFSEKESDVALSQLINLDEIAVNDKGAFQLTPKSQGYFSSQQENRPKIQCLEDISKRFKFDLLTFSYVKQADTLGNANSAVRLYPSTETLSTSAKSAKSAFQRHFHQIHDEEDFGFLSISNPELYKISSFKKQSESFKRFTQVYGIDTARNSMEPIINHDFLSNEEVVFLLSNHLRERRPANNMAEIAKIFDGFNFDYGVSALKRGYVDSADYNIESRKSLMDDRKLRPLIGSLILDQNWEIFEKYLSESIADSSDKVKIAWVAPSDTYWARSEKQLNRFKSLSDRKKVELRLFLPVPHRNDRSVKKSYVNQFKAIKDDLFGFVEGYLTGFEELVIINGEFAFLICYLYQGENLLPIPIGFHTKDREIVDSLAAGFSGYLSGLDENLESRNLGKLG